MRKPCWCFKVSNIAAACWRVIEANEGRPSFCGGVSRSKICVRQKTIHEASFMALLPSCSLYNFLAGRGDVPTLSADEYDGPCC